MFSAGPVSDTRLWVAIWIAGVAVIVGFFGGVESCLLYHADKKKEEERSERAMPVRGYMGYHQRRLAACDAMRGPRLRIHIQRRLLTISRTCESNRLGPLLQDKTRIDFQVATCKALRESVA